MPPKKYILITKFTTIIRKLPSILGHHQIKIIVACTPTVISLLPQSAPPDIRREQAQVTEKLN